MPDQIQHHAPDGQAVVVVADRPAAPVANLRHVVAMAAGMWLATRLALVAFAYFAVLLGRGGAQHAIPVSPGALIQAPAQWDATWYLGIAQSGYFSQQATAFFPLYPLLVRLVGAMIGGHWLAAGLLVSNLGTLGGFIGLALLATHEFGSKRIAALAVNSLAAYPLAFFLAAPYTEGPFIALAAFALLFARLGRSDWAAGCAFLAMLTRPMGLALVAPIVWEHGRRQGWWSPETWRTWRQWRTWWQARQLLRCSRRMVAEGVAVFAAAPSALCLYMAYLAVRFGDPLLFLHAEQRYWGHVGVANLIGAASPTHAVSAPSVSIFALTYDQARSLVDLLPLAIFLILTFLMARRLPLMYTLYTSGLLLFCLASPRPDRLGIFVSAGRYLCAALPVFLLLGRWAQDRPWLETLLVSLGFLLQAVFAACFLSGQWMV